MATRRNMVVAAALALAVCALPRSALADRLRVAVIPGIAVNVDAARVDTLAQALADALRAELDIDVLGGLEVRRKLPVDGLPPDCIATQACIDDVARRLSAQQLLFVVMIDTGTGGAVQIDTTWVDASARRTVSRPALDIASLATAQAQFAAAARQLLPDAPVRAKPSAGNVAAMSEPVARHFAVPSYITTGATAVGLGVGLGFGLSARSKYRSCESMASAGSACSTSRKDSIRTTDLIADTGWAIAIGGTVATAILYATSGDESHVIVEPIPGGAAISASGKF